MAVFGMVHLSHRSTRKVAIIVPQDTRCDLTRTSLEGCATTMDLEPKQLHAFRMRFFSLLATYSLRVTYRSVSKNHVDDFLPHLRS